MRARCAVLSAARIGGFTLLSGVMTWAGSCGAVEAGSERTDKNESDRQWRELREEVFARPSIGLDLHLGLGTPTGFVGAMVDWSPVRYFALDGGAGLTSHGVHGALHGRLRLPIGSGIAFGLGGGVSVGPFAHDGDSLACISCRTDRPDLEWNFAVFRNVDVSVEVHTQSALQTRFYVGIGGLLNPGAATCSGAKFFDECPYPPPDYLYVGASVGHAWFL